MTPLGPLPDHDPLTTAEAGVVLGIGHRNIQNWVRAGRFPNAFRTPGMGPNPGHWRIPRQDVVDAGRRMGLWP